MPQLDLLNPFVKHLTPRLKKLGFLRNDDEFQMVLFSRKNEGDFERIGIGIEKSKNKKGEFEFGAMVGIEFGDLPPLPGFVGLPHTHERVGIETLNKKAKATQVGSDNADWKRLADQFVEWIAPALDELERRKPKMRAAHISSIDQMGRNQKKSLAIFAERKQKELRKRKPKGATPSIPSITDRINIFDVAGKLLRAKNDKQEELETYIFEDDREAHDESVWTRRHEEFIDHAKRLQADLERAPLPSPQTGDDVDKRIPVNGVLYYALWQIGWKYLYLVVSHEDTEVPISLLIGTVPIDH